MGSTFAIQDFQMFSASRPSGFAETLSFLLELLSFSPLSFEGMFEDFKNSIFLLQNFYPFLIVMNVSSLILVVPPCFWFISVDFCRKLQQNLPNP